MTEKSYDDKDKQIQSLTEQVKELKQNIIDLHESINYDFLHSNSHEYYETQAIFDFEECCEWLGLDPYQELKEILGEKN